MRPFYIGLNMAGAVSAGAYTAGVVDFLIDALDSFYAEKARQRQLFGEDYSKWTIPPHDVKLAVMSGASAGGITAAVAAAALCEEFTPASSRMPATAPNRLYRAWVQDIDIMSLMGTRDLARAGAPVTSLLDSTPLDDIAAEVLKVGNPREKRPWVADPLKLVLTVTNLGGIPYAIEAGDGSAETQTLYHADQADFELRWAPGTPEGSALGLSPYSAENWPALGEVAKATSAFPMALAPRVLKRSAGIYNNRRWRISVSDPKPADGECRCETDTKLKPNWDAEDTKQFETLNVDGGVTNNNPFACAHQELCLQDPLQAAGHNPRSGAEADRAVVNIAPFLTDPTFLIDKPRATDLFSVLGALVDTVVNQSRIQGENIKLTEDPSVFSRFAIAPSIDSKDVDALASASLSAFGGFLAQEFRDHDYQLGRRNCQRFLQAHFCVPFGNVVLGQYDLNAATVDRFSTVLDNGTTGLPLIPLVQDRLRTEIREVRSTIKAERLGPVADAAILRLRAVADRLLMGGELGWLRETVVNGILRIEHGRLRKALAGKIERELRVKGLLSV
ncbi:MAG: patatin-like phospholipase family protein [Acidobacteriota bacterium]|nr:patatin-like phospholipase family protein [Acidobacteriota bacterium]